MRVSPKPQEQSPWYLKPIYWLQVRHYGQVLLPGRLWGRIPGLLLGVAFLFGRLNRKESPVSPALRALICVRVSQINDCAFCVDINGAGYLASADAPHEKLQELSSWRESVVFSPLERRVLAYTEAMTDSRLRVDDGLFDSLRQDFDDDGLVLLTGLIAFQNMSSKFNAAINVPAQGFCKIPTGGKDG
ncbi:MAG: carboxymuconolactone decarboxylase family protein [Leptospirillum sp.]|jgi:alkylhydroperoxidase family enzyme